MSSKTRTATTARHYHPGAPLRSEYKVWIPPTSNAHDSDGERDQRTRSYDRPPTTSTTPAARPAYQPAPAPAPRPAQPVHRPSYSTTNTTTSSSSQNWYIPGSHSVHTGPGQHPSNSSLSSAGSQKYSTPATSLSGSFQQTMPKAARIDPADVPARPGSSWRSSGDRSIDDRATEERHRKSKRPSTGESASSLASTGSGTAARDIEPRRSDVTSPVRADAQGFWFSDKQPSSTSAHAGRATGPTDIFIPSEVQHARQNSFEKQARKEAPPKPSGYLSDVTETDERTPKMLSRSPPVVFPMHPPERGSKTSLVQATALPARGISPVPLRGISPSNVPPRGSSPSTASRYEPRSRNNSQNDPSGLRSPYGWMRSQLGQTSSSLSNALPADDEVVVQKLQRATSVTGTASRPVAQPYAQAGKAEPIAIPLRRTTLPGTASRDSHSSSQSSLQYLAPSMHGSSTAVNNVNGSRTSLTATFSPPPVHLPRVPSNSAVAQTTSMLPPLSSLAHLRSPSQTALPPSSITSPASTRPPTAQPSGYARLQTSYMPASSATNNVLSPTASSTRHLPPATPYRSAFTTLPPSHATAPFPDVPPVPANGSAHTQVHAPVPRSVAQTPYHAAAALPASQFNVAMRDTSHFPPAQFVAAQQPQQRVQSPPHRVLTPQRAQSPPHRAQSPPHRVQSPPHRIQTPTERTRTPQPASEPQDSTSDEPAPKKSALRGSSSQAPAPPPEPKKRTSGGGFLSFLRPKRYDIWQPSIDQAKEKEAARVKESESKSRNEKQLPKEPAKLTKTREVASTSRVDTGSLSSSRENVSTSSHREPVVSPHPPTASSSAHGHSRRHTHSRQSSTTSVHMQVRIHDPTTTTSRTTTMALEAMSAQMLGQTAAIAVPAPGRRSPGPKLPFKLFPNRRTRRMSTASLEALDGKTISTVMNSPASSTRSPTPGASPPQRDPGLATLQWRDSEEAELVTSGRTRRRRPGVTFDIALEDSPMAGERPRPSKARMSTPRGTPRPLPAHLDNDHSDDDEESDDDDDDQ